MNFIYFSPNFPDYGWKFCDALKQNGVNVLGIGDAPYDDLLPELKNALTEYYRVDNLGDYDQVYRACAYFAFRYGRLDAIRSNNEFWLITEAKLRTDFNIDGIKYPEIMDHKQKSRMKAFFERAGVPAAKWCLPASFAEGKAFTDANGFPVVVKPDDGVGATDTYTLHNEQEMADFFAQKPENIPYIMEEFINGHVETFDGITDRNGDIRFCASQIYHQSLMDTVVNDDCIMYRSDPVTAEDLKEAGIKIVKAYGIKDTFFHFEFFRTTDGGLKALEVNMRPPGGMITEIYQASHDLNVYKLWADILIKGYSDENTEQRRFSGYASRKHRFRYALSHEEILERFGDHIMEDMEITGITARAMGDHVYLLYADSREEITGIIDAINARL